MSSAFAALVVWGLSMLDLLSFTWQTVAAAAVALMLLTFLVIR